MTIAADVCLDDGPRRAALRATDLNGIDYVEVDEHDCHLLTVYFVSKLGPLADTLTKANFVITGGARVGGLTVTEVKVCEPVDEEVDDAVAELAHRLGIEVEAVVRDRGLERGVLGKRHRPPSSARATSKKSSKGSNGTPRSAR